MEWSSDLVIQLIKEYRNKRDLWDSSCENYRLSGVKFEAWQDLASMFDCEIIDVKRKMNSLLASYRRERAKLAQGCNSNWFAMPYMKFLGRNKRDDEVNDDDDAEIPDEPMAQQSDSDFSEQNNVKMEHVDKRKSKLRERLVRNKPPKRRLFIAPATGSSGSRSEESRLVDALRALQKPEKKRDECDIFGEYIANSLRKHDQRTRAMIKHAMNNILFESEMKKYVSSATIHVENICQSINLTEETNPLIIPDQSGDTMPIEESIMQDAHDLGAQKLETIDNSYAN